MRVDFENLNHKIGSTKSITTKLKIDFENPNKKSRVETESSERERERRLPEPTRCSRSKETKSEEESLWGYFGLSQAVLVSSSLPGVRVEHVCSTLVLVCSPLSYAKHGITVLVLF